jgi:hypothetical protein
MTAFFGRAIGRFGDALTPPSVSRSEDAASLSLARATPQSFRVALTLAGLGTRRDAEQARTDERSHGWRSEEAAQQERSRRRSEERLRGVPSRAEAQR